jgi:hypothetical protein
MLSVVLAAGLDVAVDVSGEQLAVGTLLTPSEGVCLAEQVSMRVVSAPWLVHVGDRAEGEVCLPANRVGPLRQWVRVDPPPPGQACGHCPPAGTILETPTCADAPALRYARPIAAEELAAVKRVEARYKQHFGQSVFVAHSGFGYLGLPLQQMLSKAEIVEEQSRESLVTAEQREKATTAIGARQGLGEVYTHFLGADARFTDFWGSEALVTSLVDLAAGWYPHCLTLHEEDANPRSCTLQVGDLAYYNAMRPDPLGHYDHPEGHCVDLRLFRNDGSRYEAWYNRSDDRNAVEGGYSASLTREFLEYAVANVPNLGPLYFNDPSVIGGLSQVEARPRHDDHIHLCVKPTVPGH